jgi:hypothetical protein
MWNWWKKNKNGEWLMAKGLWQETDSFVFALSP